VGRQCVRFFRRGFPASALAVAASSLSSEGCRTIMPRRCRHPARGASHKSGSPSRRGTAPPLLRCSPQPARLGRASRLDSTADATGRSPVPLSHYPQCVSSEMFAPASSLPSPTNPTTWPPAADHARSSPPALSAASPRRLSGRHILAASGNSSARRREFEVPLPHETAPATLARPQSESIIGECSHDLPAVDRIE